MKKIFLIITTLIIITCLYLYCAPKFQKNRQESYSEPTLEKINEQEKKATYNHEYSKTLEQILLNNLLIEKYYNEYLDITYQDSENFLNNINVFLQKGYNAQEINDIYKMSDQNINKLLNKNYYDIKKYYQIKNFDANNIERYIIYQKNTDKNIQDVITEINIGIDLKPYTQSEKINNPDDFLVLVNKFNYLDESYKPNDLVAVTGFYGIIYMRSIAKDNFIKLQNAINNDLKVNILPTTAYRGFAFQQNLYNNYVKKDGIEAADTYSARPGFSEHQTGLAIDLKDSSLSTIRINDTDYTWLKNNAYKYGFIIRFPANKEKLTGYQEENWHIRYVGLDAAQKIHDSELSLEEYIDLYYKKY
jgi:LAS superfamily LD-carboxypeptidase LdcB